MIKARKAILAGLALVTLGSFISGDQGFTRGPLSHTRALLASLPSTADASGTGEITGHTTSPSHDDGNVEQLKQSSWWAQVQENIRKSEYEIRGGAKSQNPDGVLSVVNRANNFRVRFASDQITLKPRMIGEPDEPRHLGLRARESGSEPAEPPSIPVLGAMPGPPTPDWEMGLAITGFGIGQPHPAPSVTPTFDGGRGWCRNKTGKHRVRNLSGVAQFQEKC